MKSYTLFFFFSLISFCYSCRHHLTDTKELKVKKSALPEITQHSKSQTKGVIVYVEDGDTLSYSNDELSVIEQLFPVFNETIARQPSEAYYFSGIWKEYLSPKGDTLKMSFGSEAGQDQFYLLYAYYLKKKNGINKYETERKTLNELYHTINGIYEGLDYGGTYYGHQYKRIAAFVEYSVYLYRINPDYYNKKYDFSKQKDLYLKQIRQYIDDEESQNVYNKIKDKNYFERKLAFNEKMKMLDSLITSYFYLNQVHSFEITNYK